MLEEIKHRLADSENVYFCATEEETRYLLSIIEQAEKALTYYAEEPYIGSIGYSAEAIEALKAIRGN